MRMRRGHAYRNVFACEVGMHTQLHLYEYAILWVQRGSEGCTLACCKPTEPVLYRKNKYTKYTSVGHVKWVRRCNCVRMRSGQDIRIGTRVRGVPDPD
jgi:hypothetical protein